MLRNEVWQCSGAYYYTDRAPPAIGQTQQQRWKNILRKLWSRPEMIVGKSLGWVSILSRVVCFAQLLRLFQHFPTQIDAPACGDHATAENGQGSKKSSDLRETDGKISRFVCNGLQWIKSRGQKMGDGLFWRPGRSLCRNWATTCFNIGEHSCHKCNLFVCGACLWRSSWEDLITR